MGDWAELPEDVQEKRRKLFSHIGELMGVMDELSQVDPVCDGTARVWQWIRQDGTNITWSNDAINQVTIVVQVPMDELHRALDES